MECNHVDCSQPSKDESMKTGKSQRDALNEFMKRITGSIDK